MINFRYHLISIVAVFLALGIGIVMGSTVIDRAIVNSLENRIDTAEKNSIERKVENDRLEKSVKNQDAQDTALAGHTVRGYLNDQTVYVLTIGNIPDAALVETRELLAVSEARLGAEIKFNSDYLISKKSNIASELNTIEGVEEFQAGEKNIDRQIALTLAEALSLNAGTVKEQPIPADQVFSVFAKYNAFSEQEKTISFDPVQPVSFIVLVNRTDLLNENIVSVVTNMNTSFPTTIGLVGTDQEKPTRANSVKLFGEQLSAFSVVDNVESPSGRAAMIVAHSGTITGNRAVFGISNQASAFAPELTAS